MNDFSGFNLELNGSFQAFVEAFRGFLSGFLTEIFTFLAFLFTDITPGL